MGHGHRAAAAAVLAAGLCLSSCAFSEPEEKPVTDTVTASTTAAAAAPAAVETTTTAPEPAPLPEIPREVAPEYIVGDGDVTLYNVTPIAEAYHSGDRSQLDETDLAILDKAAEVIDSVITADMSDYEKELAVHDYIIKNCTYDRGSLAVIPSPAEHGGDPYGVLINGTAICKGYATTFRLFMEMLDIPCETVFYLDPMSSAHDHAWNIVTIDGSPYYVDVTWDDPIPDDDERLTYHEYFNVSRHTLDYDHELSDSLPETPVLTYAYASVELSPEPNSAEELAALAQSAIEKDNCSVIFIPSPDGIWKKSLSRNSDATFHITGSELLTAINGGFNAVGCRLTEIKSCETDRGFALTVFFKRN